MDSETRPLRGAERIAAYLKTLPDQPGVYRVYSRFEENGRVGTCPGAPGGSYQIYAVDRDSPYRVLFADDLPRRLKDQDKLPVSGSVNPAIKQGAVYYSVVAPGMLLDEGRRPLTDGRFSFDLFPAEFSAQFTNLQDQPDLPNREPLGLRPAHWPRFLRTLFRGERDRRLTDTIEVAVFVEGRDADGRPATAGAKFILRGDEVVVPPMFLARRGGRRP